MKKLASENDLLRAKVEKLRSLTAIYKPDVADNIEDEFVPGVNKEVVLARVENMLADEKVNIKWLPDVIEKQIYLNVLSLMLQVMNDVLKGMSMEFAGHRIKFNLTFLDVKMPTTPEPPTPEPPSQGKTQASESS
ncbi:hypothetical protein CYMTET_20083 [Cymbomonas tetramitiformis]|uniref:Uncharacterized protein n=1 Tax=Cymbomonas tetramitiformis TaxID=36881 RepID=A0AAE0G5C3_9CHLO|nr:hypothetical protein CYMTET_20083 [Cymbomonas tetramitiformis]